MIRLFFICVLTAAAALAQNAPPASLAALEQTARQRAADWEKLSQALEGSLVRLLPCDPKINAGINDVSRASEARLAALTAYLQAALQQASQDAGDAKRAAAAGDVLASDLSVERADVAQEQAGVNGQLTNLDQSAKRRASLEDPQKTLRQIAALVQQRADLTQTAAGSQTGLTAALREAADASAAREQALREMLAASDTERGRWNGYYAARLTRAQTECAITRGTLPAPTPAKGARGKKR